MSFPIHHHRLKRFSDGEFVSAIPSASPGIVRTNTTASILNPVLSATIASYYGSSSSSSFALSQPTALSIANNGTYIAGNGTNATAVDLFQSSVSGYSVSDSLSSSRNPDNTDSTIRSTFATSRTSDAIVATIVTASQVQATTSSSANLLIPSTTPSATPNLIALTPTNKAILGGVLGGLGGIGLVCALVFVVLSKGNTRKRPASLEGLTTPQRMRDSQSTIQSPLQKPASRFKTSLTLSSSRSHTTSTHRSRKYSEPPSPSGTGTFQVISGRRLSSPPMFSAAPGEATRNYGSTHSSPRSAMTTPTRRSRLGGTAIVFRDGVGRSHDMGSTASHISRFIERIDDT